MSALLHPVGWYLRTLIEQMMRSYTALALSISACLFAVACGDDEETGSADESPPAVGDAGPIHVHGLGVNPADGALFVATHTGLFRVPPGKSQARRVADRFQDTMGFTVTGPDRFLGSGHPDGREGLPPFLGLIRSTDAGRSWQPVSLLGERDFHVLEAVGSRVYGYGSDFESRQASLLVSEDSGRSWEERTPPEPLLSLAIDPGDPERVIASGEDGLHTSTDAGRGWRSLGNTPGMLAWPEQDELFLVGFDGSVARSSDAGRSWSSVGAVNEQPAAFDSANGELYVALHDGTVLRSGDEGRSWQVRSRP